MGKQFLRLISRNGFWSAVGTKKEELPKFLRQNIGQFSALQNYSKIGFQRPLAHQYVKTPLVFYSLSYCSV